LSTVFATPKQSLTSTTVYLTFTLKMVSLFHQSSTSSHNVPTRSTTMALEYQSPAIHLNQFPYFDSGDVEISLSPCERQMVLHSHVLSKYFGVFRQNQGTSPILKASNYSLTSIEDKMSELPKRRRYELDATAVLDVTEEVHLLLRKVL
jgi:hypothetical protein